VIFQSRLELHPSPSDRGFCGAAQGVARPQHVWPEGVQAFGWASGDITRLGSATVISSYAWEGLGPVPFSTAFVPLAM